MLARRVKVFMSPGGLLCILRRPMVGPECQLQALLFRHTHVSIDPGRRSGALSEEVWCFGLGPFVGSPATPPPLAAENFIRDRSRFTPEGCDRIDPRISCPAPSLQDLMHDDNRYS
jgi:hypothetical protein